MFKKYEPSFATFKPKKDQFAICNIAAPLKILNTVHIRKMQDADLAIFVQKIMCGSFDLQAILTIRFSGCSNLL